MAAEFAFTFKESGVVHEAMELQEKVMAASQRTWGNEHPNTLEAMSNLALISGKRRLETCDGQVNGRQVDNPVEIDGVPESNNPGDKPIHAEYVLKDSNQVKTGMEIDDRNGDSELGQ
ncbi:hypothetical protein MMC31_002691, partial [Peltigera leucophlebia]|nr:hypothetical protein [Peltigera leucophlebia]